MTDRRKDIFDTLRLPLELDARLRSATPWWEGKPGRVLSVYRRWAFQPVLHRLETGLAPAVVLRGARQVGKTTLLEQAIAHLIGEAGIGVKRIPVEVKYRRHIDPHRDTLGLRSFLEKTHDNAPFGVLVTMLDDVPMRDPRASRGSGALPTITSTRARCFTIAASSFGLYRIRAGQTDFRNRS